jgi:iron complex transport system ATP-binding protein
VSAVRLSTRSLGFGYGARVVGRDVDIDVRPGEVLCLLGPNGSGKTTLFKTLLGLPAMQEGEVLLDGTPLARLTRQEIARRVAYVPQAQAAYFSFSVIDMVLMGRTAHLGLFAAPFAPGSGKSTRCTGSPGYSKPGRTRIHTHQRRAAPARPRRSRASPRCTHHHHGRADR